MLNINTVGSSYGMNFNIRVKGPGYMGSFSTKLPYCEIEVSNYGRYSFNITATDRYGNVDTTYESYYFAPPLEGNFYQSSNVGLIGENITFTAHSTGGYGSHSYKFYKRYKGVETVLRDYSYSNSISTTFDEYGDYEVLVDIKDENGEIK